MKKQTHKQGNKVFIGVDYGEARIGLAFGSVGLTMPLQSVNGANVDNAINELLRLSIENKAARIVVGLPVREDGSLTPQSLKVKEFVKRLRARTKIPVDLVDEHLTTKEAVTHAINYGVSKKGRSTVDSMAAEIILKRYFADKGI